jgi:hypothetical protein
MAKSINLLDKIRSVLASMREAVLPKNPPVLHWDQNYDLMSPPNPPETKK